jgi:flagellar basal body P-ring protein FlgI
LVLAAIVVLALGPASAAPGKKKKKEPPPPKVSETVGDLAFVVSTGEMKVEGVGLVTGLENTGADPPGSWYRQQLVDEMTKAGVEKADKLLASPQVSMVLVRMTIPMGVNPSDKLDVQVEVPPACGTKSLAGGYLLATRLYEVAIAKGATLKGHELAIAQGPVVIGTPAKPNDPKSGRVLGGGRVKKDYPYTLVIKENRESFRTAKMLETVINERFHDTDDSRHKGVATGKTSSYLVLRVPPLYHQNQERFFRIVQLLSMIDSPELRPRRLATWSKELLDPKTAGVAALKLEGLGSGSVEALLAGLKSVSAQVRFFSAEALAYLNDTTGVDTLGETVVKQPEFRVYALAALAALDQAASHMMLRKLMDQPEREIRYGAFNALRTLDPHDPFLGQIRVLNAPPRDDEDEPSTDSMALAISAAARGRKRPEDPFALYVVDSEGPPLVHVSRTRRAEVVIFGRQQKLLPPIVLGTGPILINAADNDERIELTKIVPSRPGEADSKITTSLELADLVRQAANLGASYPQIVTILEAANRQRNLPGQLVVDAVPAASDTYLEAILGRDVSSKRDDALRRASAESSGPRWRRLFGLFNRETPSNPTPAAPLNPPARPDAATPASASPGDTPVASPGPASPSAAKKSGDPPNTPMPKADDAVQKASSDSSGPRWRLFDLFRRSDEP